LHWNKEYTEVIAAWTSYHAILTEFSELTFPAGTLREVKHLVLHFICTTTCPPVSCRQCRLASYRLKIARDEFEIMLRKWTARRFDGPWSFSLHLVPKKTDGWCPCGDYRTFNARTVPDCYPVRCSHDFVQRLRGRTIFLIIDLLKFFT